jgi:hypothetical protein
MTLSERNTFFKIGIIFCAICTLFILAASFVTIPLYQETDDNLPLDHSTPAGEHGLSFGGHSPQITNYGLYQGTALDIKDNIRRPNNIIAVFTGFFLGHNYFAVHTTLAMLVLFSLVGMIFIHSFFERTSAPEILYIAIFTISFAFEALRLVLPLHLVFNFPSVYVRVAARVLLFTRFFCIFSLFAASICAAGLEVQKNRNVIFIIVIATLVVTLYVPIDVLSWDTSFNMVNGFTSMFRLIEITAFLTTMISFFIAAKIRGSKEYNYVAIGIMLALIGRSILLSTDNWIGPVPGIFLLSFGTWFLCSKLHKIHLWL